VKRAADQNARLFGSKSQATGDRQRDDAREFREKDKDGNEKKNADRKVDQAAHQAESDTDIAAKI